MEGARTKSQVLLLTFVLILIVVSAYLFRAIYVHQKTLLQTEEIRYNSYLLATELRHSSNELTRLVRTYAATANPVFEEQYWKVLAIRNGESQKPKHYDRVYWDFLTIKNSKPPYESGEAISLHDTMKAAGFSDSEFSLLENAQRNSDKLVKLEEKSMNAMKGLYLDDEENFTITAKPDQKWQSICYIAMNITKPKYAS